MRYKSFVISNSQIIIYIFLKSLVLFSKVDKFNFNLFYINRDFFCIYFTSRFWLTFKKFFYKKYGLYSNNLVKSIMYNFFTGMNRFLYDETVIRSTKHTYKLDNSGCIYSKPITVVNFSLNKKLYKSYMLFIITKLVTIYIPFIPTFEVNYSFFFMGSNLYFYSFINCFYFKVHNV